MPGVCRDAARHETPGGGSGPGISAGGLDLKSLSPSLLMLPCASANFDVLMNSQRIRERWHRDTRPFVFRLSDGTRVPVAHPDFMMMPPGFGLIIVFGRK